MHSDQKWIFRIEKKIEKKKKQTNKIYKFLPILFNRKVSNILWSTLRKKRGKKIK